MAIPQTSAEHKDAVEPAVQTLQHIYRVHPTGAHGEQDPDIGGILQARDTGKVRRGIGAPIAEKCQDLRFEPIFHVPLLSFLLGVKNHQQEFPYFR
jgi:hypothetical protein